MAKMAPERRAKIRKGAAKDLLEMDLRAIREMQGNLSKLEKNGSRRLDVLSRYIEALGGEVEVRANFGDKSVRLSVDLHAA
jgi:hypothetical protein